MNLTLNKFSEHRPNHVQMVILYTYDQAYFYPVKVGKTQVYYKWKLLEDGEFYGATAEYDPLDPLGTKLLNDLDDSESILLAMYRSDLDEEINENDLWTDCKELITLLENSHGN